MDDEPPPDYTPIIITHHFKFNLKVIRIANLDTAFLTEDDVVTFNVPHTLGAPSTRPGTLH